MARLIHLNGPPGIGKSTIAKRYADEHPGVLNCDIDVLRSFIGGWASDFARAGALIRPAALAMITAYLASGHDVVLPQMLLDPAEVERFEACAAEAGGSFVERFLMDDVEHAVARFGRRGEADPGNPWHGQVQGIVAANGGDLELVRCHAALLDLFGQRSSAVAVPSVDGAVEDTYQRLICSLT